MSYESTQCRMKTTCDSMKALINQRMRDEEKSIDYLKRFKASRDVFFSHVGKNFAFPQLLEDHEEYGKAREVLNQMNSTQEAKDAAMKEMETIRKELMDQFLVFVYLENTDRSRCGSIVTGLEAQCSLGNDQHPKNLIVAQNVIENHQCDESYRRKRKEKTRSEIVRIKIKKELTKINPFS